LAPDLDQQLSTWMKHAQDGDRKAYADLLTEVTGLLQSFVRQRLGQPAGVDDVVQETLISIHRHRHTYDPSRSFGAWMYAIARHRMIDWTRRRQRLGAHETLAESADEDIARAVAPGTERPAFARLHRALESLSEVQREVIQLMKWDGFSVREVAESRGMTESSVKINAHRGYKVLRKLLASGSDAD
jgi:RNA polymerase sigma factor (sigma-70 family)